MQEFEITLETAPEKTELVLIPEQTKLEQIAKQYQKNYSDRIVLACVDGKLRELSKVVKAPGKISFLTMTDRDGKRTDALLQQSTAAKSAVSVLDEARILC